MNSLPQPGARAEELCATCSSLVRTHPQGCFRSLGILLVDVDLWLCVLGTRTEQRCVKTPGEGAAAVPTLLHAAHTQPRWPLSNPRCFPRVCFCSQLN